MVNVVCTLIKNNIHQHSGQNLLQTNEGEHLTTVMTNAKPLSICLVARVLVEFFETMIRMLLRQAVPVALIITNAANSF